MKHKRRLIAAVIAAALAVGGFFIWTFWPKQTVLTFGMMAGSYWDVPNGNCYRIIDQTIQRFEKSHPGVVVKYTSGILKRDYSEWLSEQMLLGQAPDVFMVQPDDFNTFSSIGALKSLNDLIAGDSSFKPGSFYKASYDAGQYQGSQYALPYESVPVMMFVNKTLLQQAGISMPSNNWTWDDFYRICKQVTCDTNGDGRPDLFGYYDYTWQEAAYSNGASLFNANGTACYINNAKVVSAVQFVKNLAALSGNTEPTSREFDLGQVAFRPFLFSDYRTYKPYPWSIKKYTGFDWNCIKMPAGPSGGNVSELNTLLMGISSKTQHSRLAWEFLKMLTADPVTQQQIFQYSPGVSVLKQVTESAQTQALLSQSDLDGQAIDTTTLDEIMKSAVTAPKFRKYSSVIQMADSRIDTLISNGGDIEPALATLRLDILNYMEQ